MDRVMKLNGFYLIIDNRLILRFFPVVQNQRRGTQTAQDVIVVHDPTVVRNGTSSTGTSANANGTFSKRYQDIIREDATGPDDDGAALKGYTINNGNEVSLCYLYTS